MIKYLSLFSGIGAFEKALKNLNIDYDLIAYCEIEKVVSKAYSLLHNESESKNLWDITEVNEKELPTDVDLITYGFPCQDISQAGLKQGFTDEDGNKTRSGLFFDALRIIEHCQPKVAVAENVKNLANKPMHENFSTVLKSLETAGYNNYWKVLKATDYGIPQTRERVFIVSIRKDIDTGTFEFPQPIPLTKCMNDFLENDSDVDESFYLSAAKTKQVLTHNARWGGQVVNRNKLCSTLLARDYKDPKVIKVANLNYYGNDQMNRVYDPDGLCPTLKTVSGGGREIKIKTAKGYRKCTPREYFRLMGFTDEDYETLVQAGIKKTPIYKMAGNSIVVNVAEALFKSLQEGGYL